ncbi:hypothetical protein SAY87_015355 [Trapa incisa]|uniref:Uncharacterized protein n=1 Tax=Trapa incisa TaxID=236973 RepID=A0AAN7H100_9MYRT|nr:hypothetical protein SAY87_015355 [Trapa incisa]
MSFLSLVLNDYSIYFNSLREIYEAWVIYNFLSLCLAWVGGPGAVVLSLSGRVMKPSWFLMTCCLPPISLDGFFPVSRYFFYGAAFHKKVQTRWPAVCDPEAYFRASHGFTASLAHALMLNDFYHDTVHQFAPTYHDYVLYNHGEGDEGARKYRSRTFVPTGPEMDAVRRNKPVFGTKMNEVQLSSPSSSATSTPKASTTAPSSEAMKSSFLVDASNSSSVPYDMSVISLDMGNHPPKIPPASETGRRW